MLETGGRSNLRTVGHGSWERTGLNELVKRHRFFRFAADNATYLGPQEITRQIRMTSSDTFIAEGISTILDLNENVLAKACDREAGTRF